MSRLPSLRILHLHLYSLDTFFSQEGLHLFITAVMDLLCCLPCSLPRYSDSYASDSHTKGHFQFNSHSTSPSSQLEHLILTNHSLGREHLHFGNWHPFIINVLCDRMRFPVFNKFSWYACNFVTDYLQNHIFAGIHSDLNVILPFAVDLGFETGYIA